MNDQIPSIVVCLRSGGDYKAKHVRALFNQIQKNTRNPFHFVCYSDEQVDEISTIKLERNYPGWWSCAELWRHKGPTIAMGLDTIVKGNIDGLLQIALNAKEDEFYLLDSFFHKDEWINGIQIWNGDWSWLYEEFDFEKLSQTHRGEENYLIETLIQRKANIKSIQKKFPSICGFKHHFKRGIKRDSIVIVFYGKPRPWETPLWRWVKK